MSVLQAASTYKFTGYNSSLQNIKIFLNKSLQITLLTILAVCDKIKARNLLNVLTQVKGTFSQKPNNKKREEAMTDGKKI